MKKFFISILIIVLPVLGCHKEVPANNLSDSCNAETSNGCINLKVRQFTVTGIDVRFDFGAYIGWRGDGLFYSGNFQLMKNDSAGIYFYTFLDSIKTNELSPFMMREGYMKLSIIVPGPYKISDSVYVAFTITIADTSYCNSKGKIAVKIE
jgi:hypothetical protein